ncbi:hypothetical protein Nepgr_031735 [Nepenthes gracilis]|uniref:Uncharacterized protein n=1 Tax=Nepenthes gracilis TaxID=150966 RepID=A0AAD3Y532_NEPGR|nr:hypothetical protein Nepgr_031735 [Nepenthes gracilis]
MALLRGASEAWAVVWVEAVFSFLLLQGGREKLELYYSGQLPFCPGLKLDLECVNCVALYDAPARRVSGSPPGAVLESGSLGLALQILAQPGSVSTSVVDDALTQMDSHPNPTADTIEPQHSECRVSGSPTGAVLEFGTPGLLALQIPAQPGVSFPGSSFLTFLRLRLAFDLVAVTARLAIDAPCRSLVDLLLELF